MTSRGESVEKEGSGRLFGVMEFMECGGRTMGEVRALSSGAQHPLDCRRAD